MVKPAINFNSLTDGQVEMSFTVFITTGTNNVLLMEHTDKRPEGKMIGWIASETWANKMIEALNQYDGQKFKGSVRFTLDGKSVMYGGVDIGIFQFQTQANRVANALNHLYAAKANGS